MSHCSIYSCGREATKKGMCNKHYLRAWKHGDPHKVSTEKGALLRWIQDHKAYQGDDCLQWPFGSRPSGYGSIKVRGRHSTASAEMCRAAHGEPPQEKMEAAHSCGNGHLGCTNPNHLRWATRKENSQDTILHGRTCRGNRRATTKLDALKVNAIRHQLSQGARVCDLANQYAVTRGAINGIKNKKTWKWLRVTVFDLTERNLGNI